MLAALIFLPLAVALTTYRADFVVGGSSSAGIPAPGLTTNFSRAVVVEAPSRRILPKADSSANCSDAMVPPVNASAPTLDSVKERSAALATVATTGGLSLLLGPCCDNVDCSPGSPHYAGDCDKLLDCSGVPCPAEPQDVASRLLAGFQEPGDECKTRARPGNECTCGCRCVCVYRSGRVLWL